MNLYEISIVLIFLRVCLVQIWKRDRKKNKRRLNVYRDEIQDSFRNY